MDYYNHENSNNYPTNATNIVASGAQSEGVGSTFAPALLPFSTGLSFSRRVPSANPTIALVLCMTVSVLGFCHLWLGDASGIVFLLVALLLVAFGTSPTTFGLNALCLVTCFGVVQALTGLLGVMSTNSWQWEELLPEGRLLVCLYGCDCTTCMIAFIWSLQLLYTFDPCQTLIDLVPAGYGAAGLSRDDAEGSREHVFVLDDDEEEDVHRYACHEKDPLVIVAS